jgi:hypothetical protein
MSTDPKNNIASQENKNFRGPKSLSALKNGYGFNYADLNKKYLFDKANARPNLFQSTWRYVVWTLSRPAQRAAQDAALAQAGVVGLKLYAENETLRARLEIAEASHIGQDMNYFVSRTEHNLVKAERDKYKDLYEGQLARELKYGQEWQDYIDKKL